MKRGALYLFILIALALSMSVQSQINSKVQKIDDEEIEVIVVLKDNDNALQKQSYYKDDFEMKKNMIREQQENIFEDLKLKEKSGIAVQSDEQYDFELTNLYTTVNGFAGKIRKSSYSKLKNDPRILNVYQAKNLTAFLKDSAEIVHATKTWNLIYSGANITGKGQTVCIVDSGVDYTHGALGDCTTASFLNGTCRKVIGGYDFVNDDNDPIDDLGHGTHIAGIVASTDNVFKGIASDSSIVAIKVLNKNGGGSTPDLISGIDWCVHNATKFNISVISISLGIDDYKNNTHCDTSDNPLLVDAIHNAVSRNISVIVAAGNDGAFPLGVSSPACISNVTVVGSADKRDSISSSSSRWELPMLFAPGSSIVSLNLGNGFISRSGTSMATPHVSGAFALLQQYRRLEQNGILTPSQIQDALNDTGKQIEDSSSELFFSRINIYNALLSLDKTFPNITLVAPTPLNNSNISSPSFIINITSNEVLSTVILEFNSLNETINATKIPLNWMINKTVSIFGVFNYRIYGNDSAGNMMITATFQVVVNNSSPIITSFFPSELNASINEPDNLTFNVTVVDKDSDLIEFSWFQDGTIKSTSNAFTFSSNFTASGYYNITLIVSDGNSATSVSWNLTVNNTNFAPNVMSVNLTNTDFLNRTNGTLLAFWDFFDFDNDTITANETRWYNNGKEIIALRNLTVLFLDKTIKGDNWTFSVRIFDGFNWSQFLNSTPNIIQNSRASLTLTDVTESIRETELAIINFTMSDLDNDPINITTQNLNLVKVITNNLTDEKGTVIYFGSFVWQTGLNDNGEYFVSISASDGLDEDTKEARIFVSDASDFDGDGNPDFNDTDDDNDNVNDTEDMLFGNSSHINTSTIVPIVEIANSIDLNKKFDGEKLIRIYNNNKIIVEFAFNFSQGMLDLRNISINTQSNATNGITIINIKRQKIIGTKILYVDNLNNLTTLCIKDAEIISITQISSLCNGADEFGIKCPGTANNGKYNCTFIDNTNMTFNITGLIHSGIQQQSYCGDGIINSGESCSNCPVDAGSCPSTEGSGGGGGGGGGGSGGGGSGSGAFFVCNQDWQCNDWSACINGVQTRNCEFVKVPQHASDTQCPSISNPPITSQSCEVIEEKALVQEALEKREEEVIIKTINENVNTTRVEQEQSQTNHSKGFFGSFAGFFRNFFGGSPTGQVVADTSIKPYQSKNPIIGIVTLVFTLFLSINVYYRFYKKEQFQQWIEKRKKK